MFTGIVQKVGRVIRLEKTSETAYLLLVSNEFAKGADPVELGESVANNGVCLTATEITSEHLRFDLSPETILRSSLSRLKPGSKVNLERSLRMGDRLSGHWVQGHVDGTAKLVTVKEVESGYYDLEISLNDASLARYCVKKGSLCLDGISLTIHDLQAHHLHFQIIPHTWAETALSDLHAGESLNIEVDILAKYIERFHDYDQNAASRN